MKKRIALSFILFVLVYGIAYLGVSWISCEWMPSPFNPTAWDRDIRLLAFIWLLICVGVAVNGALDGKLKEKIRDSSER